jgi:hydroxymethylpyrimidine/phosphomethylpyrimidine kinase
MEMKVVLSIAGSDSGGGAGIQADLKTFEAHGVFGTTAITSITAQNTSGVRAIADVPVDVIAAQIDAVFDDFAVAAVKIGMVRNAAMIHCIAERLRERSVDIPIVLDPVMIATSGDRLMRDDAVAAIVSHLIPLAMLVTPNLDEAEVLSGMSIHDVDEMGKAAVEIVQRGARAVLLKGGHLPQRETAIQEVIDVLFDGEREHRFTAPWIPTTSTHGTGCTLSSAIAANLALGVGLVDAVRHAQVYVHEAIVHAPGLGNGSGPLFHGWKHGNRSRDT